MRFIYIVHNQLAARPKYPLHLGQGQTAVGIAAESHSVHQRVEEAIGIRQGTHIGDLDIGSGSGRSDVYAAIQAMPFQYR
jgi:hypothetical protein